uniref:Uncharacterized protein n=1 Tax=Arundo donax TaxID=35708 RepID=A0A0A8Z1R7_ARUDO
MPNNCNIFSFGDNVNYFKNRNYIYMSIQS